MSIKQGVRYALILLLLFLTSFLFADDQYKYVHAPDSDIYFGHISYTEAMLDGKHPLVIREGKPRPESGDYR